MKSIWSFLVAHKKGKFMPIESQTPNTYVYQISRHLTENKNDFLKLINLEMAVIAFLAAHENEQ